MGDTMVVVEIPKSYTLDGQGRLKFYSVDERHLAYKTWEEMSPREREYVRGKHPDYVAEQQVADEDNRYAAEIAYFEERIVAMREYARQSPPGPQRSQAAVAVQKYQQGIDIRREAAGVPEEQVWFVVMPNQLRSFVAPHFGPNDIEFPNETLIQSIEHVIDTSDPLRITHLRRMIAMGEPGLSEQPVGRYPLLSKYGDFIAWSDREGYERHARSLIRLAH